MSILYRKYSANGTNSVFIHPSDSTQKLRFTVTALPKKISGLSLINRRVSIKSNTSADPRGLELPAGVSPVLEPLSVELIVSGSIGNGAALKRAVADVITAYNAKVGDLLDVGVAPDENTGLVISVPVEG